LSPWLQLIIVRLCSALPVLVEKLAPQQAAGVIRNTPQPLFCRLLFFSIQRPGFGLLLRVAAILFTIRRFAVSGLLPSFFLLCVI